MQSSNNFLQTESLWVYSTDTEQSALTCGAEDLLSIPESIQTCP